MVIHPLRAFRPSITRFFGFDQGALCLAIALIGHWSGLPSLSFLATAGGIVGLARGTIQVRAAALRRQQAEGAVEVISSPRSSLTP